MSKQKCFSDSLWAMQKGDAFDMATLLCSVLLGSGFDAFVVIGRAQKRIALNDQSQQPCPFSEPSAEALLFQGPDSAISALGQGTCGMEQESDFVGKPAYADHPLSDSSLQIDPDDSKAAAGARGDDICCLEVSGIGSANSDMAIRPSPSKASGEDVRFALTAALSSTAVTATVASDVASITEGPIKGISDSCNGTEDEAANPHRLDCPESSSSAVAGSVHAWVLVKANRKVSTRRRICRLPSRTYILTDSLCHAVLILLAYMKPSLLH